MSEDTLNESLEEKVDEAPVLEVKVVNKELRESSPYDGHDDLEYDDLTITKKEIKEFEDGDSSG